jgi:PAS domain S-box-containing protein
VFSFQPVSAIMTPIKQSRGMNGTTRILVVDDDPHILDVFSELLLGEGYQVWRAATGRDGLQLAREKHPNLVLLDVMLPDISGLEVCRQIKSDAALSDVFVALISGAAINPGQKADGLGSGADEYLLKSGDWSELRARIRTLARLQQTTAALRASEQYYRRLVEILPDGVSIVDLEGRLMAVNSQAVAMLGYEDQAELMQKSAFDLTPPDEHERVTAQMADALQSGILRDAGITVLRKNGEHFPAELSIAVLKDTHDRPFALVCVWRDVTQRKLAEEILRASTERFRQVAENIREVFWITNALKDEMIYISPGYEEIWGRTCEELYASPHAWLEGIHPDDRERVLEAARTKQTSGDYDEVYRIVRPDGTIRWIQDRAFPIRDESGQVYRVVGIAEDITTRKRAEESLRESEARKGAIMQAALDGIITIDHTGRIMEVNFAAEKMFGYRRSQIIGKEMVSVLFPQPLHQWFERGLAGLFAVEEGPTLGSRFELTALRAHHVEFPVDFSISRVELPGPPVFTAFVRDISSRKRAEAKLTTLVHAMETTTEPIYITDLKNRITFVNQAFQKTYGYVESEVLGKTPEIISSPKNSLSTIAEVLAQTLLGDWRGELVHRRKDGVEIPIFLSTSQIKDQRGQIVGLMRLAQDITERRHAEHLLRLQRDFGVSLSTVDDLSSAFGRLLELVLQLEGIDCGWISLVQLESGGLKLEAHQGLPAGAVEQVRRLVADPAQAALMKSGRPAAWQNLDGRPEPDGKSGHEKVSAIETVPLMHRGEVIAVLNVGSHALKAIPTGSRLAIEAIGAQAGGAISRIRAEDLLRANRALLEKIIHSIRAAVFVFDAGAGHILDCNPAASRIFGYAREEMIGQPVSRLHLDDGALAQFMEHVRSAARDDGFPGEFEFAMRRKDGASFPAAHSLKPIRNESGRLLSWVSVIRDVTARAQIEEGLRQLPRRIIEAQEAERLRVARELHDGVNQVIASAKMRLGKVEEHLAAADPAAKVILARCHALLGQALEENRRIAYNLRPSDLDELGLASACRNFCKELAARANLAVKCHLSRSSRRLPPAIELNLFRIVQEAVNNVEKHARAKTVRLRITFQGDTILLKVQDDGRGFEPRTSGAGKGKWRGIGITNMRERAASLGGSFEVQSVPHEGTTITVRVPCKPAV